MTVILIDRVGSVVFQNGILRFDCIVAGPNGEERPAGTLLIPANQASAVLQSLIGATKELDRRLREQVQQAGAAGAEGAVAADGDGSAENGGSRGKKAPAGKATG
jgi:hypothetical protein